jgi:hypothetical protein
MPHTIEFLIDGARQIRATRVATLEELAKGVSALDDAIEYPSAHKASAMSPYLHLEFELTAQRYGRASGAPEASEPGRSPPRRRPSLRRFFLQFQSERRQQPKRPRLSTGWQFEKKRRSKSTLRLLRWIGATRKRWTRTTYLMNGSCRRSSSVSIARISPASLTATFGSSLGICRAKPDKGCGKDIVANLPSLRALKASPKVDLRIRANGRTAKSTAAENFEAFVNRGTAWGRCAVERSLPGKVSGSRRLRYEPTARCRRARRIAPCFRAGWP